MTSNEKMKDAEKSIKMAKYAMSVENYEKAKRMLIKAERMYPTDIAQQLLKEIEKITLNNDKCVNSNEIDIDTAENCINIARVAIANNDTHKAERFLLKSIKIRPLDQGTELLEKLKNGHKYNDPASPTGTLESAEECIEKAQNAFIQGDNKKALHLLIKSELLCPTSTAKDLMKQVKEKVIENGEDPDEVVKEKNIKEVRLSSFTEDADVPTPQPIKTEVTSEQISAIQRVKQAKNDYDILGIPKGSALNEAKKAYKYLIKILHPDKNRAPGAKEAFMMVKEAWNRLKKSNP